MLLRFWEFLCLFWNWEFFVLRIDGPLVSDFCSPVHIKAVFLQVAYEQEDYYHSVPWLEESVRLFRLAGGKWSPENEGTLEDALDHLAFSHFKVGWQTFWDIKPFWDAWLNSSKVVFLFQTGNISYALSLSHELLHYGKIIPRFAVCPKSLQIPEKHIRHLFFSQIQPMEEFCWTLRNMRSC